MKNPRSTIHYIDAIIKAADRLDPALINEFLTSSLESAQTHYEVLKPTLNESQRIHHERLICNASILCRLFVGATIPIPPAPGEV